MKRHILRNANGWTLTYEVQPEHETSPNKTQVLIYRTYRGVEASSLTMDRPHAREHYAAQLPAGFNPIKE